jgi:cell wall-associated NlpC family hydrolase
MSKKYWLSIVCMVFFSGAWASVAEDSTATSSHPRPVYKIPQTRVDSIIELGKTFLHKPYKYRGPSPWAMDCSGYLAYIFSRFGHDIPRSSGAMARVAQEVHRDSLKIGDFIFFKGRNAYDTRVGHVSMVIGIEGETLTMMHSCSRGIIIEEYPKISYYKKRFVKFGRLVDMDADRPILPPVRGITPATVLLSRDNE